jgi:hypothetical protein
MTTLILLGAVGMLLAPFLAFGLHASFLDAKSYWYSSAAKLYALAVASEINAPWPLIVKIMKLLITLMAVVIFVVKTPINTFSALCVGAKGAKEFWRQKSD